MIILLLGAILCSLLIEENEFPIFSYFPQGLLPNSYTEQRLKLDNGWFRSTNWNNQNNFLRFLNFQTSEHHSEQLYQKSIAVSVKFPGGSTGIWCGGLALLTCLFYICTYLASSSLGLLTVSQSLLQFVAYNNRARFEVCEYCVYWCK